ncbi:helix-turn-helix transcriptional regulator [Niveispirillum fermenti]|uniref:helix-turn-helix transcriptional regulator n=1 Tax=Niveispirillum fermenti TaxID=1233113 RepID=UPI003A84FAB5
MRRADRLFQIIQILRRASRPVTAEIIATELEISRRSIYRDIATLIGQRVPIRGEAGIGYMLEGGFDMPPLMLTPDEIEVAMLGAQWVARQGDPVLVRAAADLMAKIEASVPEDLRPVVQRPAGVAPPRLRAVEDSIDMVALRAAIHAGHRLHLTYRDEQGRETVRTIWPVLIVYFDNARTLAAWCEMRRDFRHFRTDRVVRAEFTGERYPERTPALRARWRRSWQQSAEE